MSSTKLSALRANPGNPRHISASKAKQLEKTLRKFGDLSGVVFNTVTLHLIGGHQRVSAFKAVAKGAEIVIDRRFKTPTKTGTVAEGHIMVNGERFSYREVEWDPVTEKIAAIAANKSAGEWDLPALTEWLETIKQDEFSDINLTMFDELELKSILGAEKGAEAKSAKEYSSDDFDDFAHKCPKCGFEFDE